MTVLVIGRSQTVGDIIQEDLLTVITFEYGFGLCELKN